MKSITLFYEKRWKQQSKRWRWESQPAELVQAGGEAMIDILTAICNKIWKTGEWPTTWTQSLVITVPKKGNLQLCQNYRTISLISHPSKVMLKIILNRLQPQVEEIIAEEQAGFRAGKSTTEQNIQSQDPLREIPAASAEYLPCLHRLQEGLWQGMARSLMGNCEEIQHQCQRYTSHWKSVWPHLKILWHGEDNSARDSERSKERKTEGEMGR